MNPDTSTIRFLEDDEKPKPNEILLTGNAAALAKAQAGAQKVFRAKGALFDACKSARRKAKKQRAKRRRQ